VSTALPAGSTIPSPCISVCRMDAASGLCVGCWRTLDEIAAWATLGDEAKRQVWLRIEQRQAAIPAFTDSRTP
jgi:predicted Fe-S protein YdhL (DUF1289 family)